MHLTCRFHWEGIKSKHRFLLFCYKVVLFLFLDEHKTLCSTGFLCYAIITHYFHRKWLVWSLKKKAVHQSHFECDLSFLRIDGTLFCSLWNIHKFNVGLYKVSSVKVEESQDVSLCRWCPVVELKQSSEDVSELRDKRKHSLIIFCSTLLTELWPLTSRQSQ